MSKASLLILIFGFAFSFNVNAIENITLLSDNWAPFNYEENGLKKGFYIEVLAAAMKKMGLPNSVQNTKILSWDVAYKRAQEDKNTMLFAMSKTDERRPLFKWACPGFTNDISVWAMSDSKISMIAEADLPNYSYATVKDDAAEQLIIGLGVSKRKLQRANNYMTNVKKLKAKEVQLIVDSLVGMGTRARKMGMKLSDFKSVYPLKRVSICYAFSKDVPDSIVNKFQKALDKLQADGTIRRIQKKYIN